MTNLNDDDDDDDDENTGETLLYFLKHFMHRHLEFHKYFRMKY